MTPGNEIGLISQYWPTSVDHVKTVPGKEIDLLLSVKHKISKNEHCLKDATFGHFVDCFKIGLRNKLLNSAVNAKSIMSASVEFLT